MQRRRFMVQTIPAAGERVRLDPAEARHAAKVLRLRLGDVVHLLDGKGMWAEAVIDDPGMGRRGDGMTCRIQQRRQIPLPTLRIHLYVAPPRGKNMSRIVREATELGVVKLTPILCEYGVSRPGPEACASWRDDAVTAAKQSGNPWLPHLEAPVPFAEALAACKDPGIYGAVESEAGVDRRIIERCGGGIAVWIGPEGGFSPEEESLLRHSPMAPVRVGPWILRVETAVPALLGMVWGLADHD